MKKILSLGFALIIVMSLVGCVQFGSDDPVSSGADMLEVEEDTQGDEIENTQEATTQEDWGITLTATDVTATGLTILCEQNGDEHKGELNTGSYYFLEIYENNDWEAVSYLPQEYDIAWTSEAWMIPENDIVEWVVEWEWLYGKLPTGEYRIGKCVMDFVETGNYEEQIYYATFEIE